jgi:hypothetical protein
LEREGEDDLWLQSDYGKMAYDGKIMAFYVWVVANMKV